MIKRTFIKTTLGLALAASFAGASAQTTPLKFQLDWRFEGPSAFFLVPAAKGYFKDAKLDVTVDAGNGSGGAVNRVASGAYDVGFADLAALMEFHANNPDAPNKPVAVMMVYNVFDAGRRAFPIFAKENKVGAVTWVSMDPPLRETMLVRGDVDAITGFTFTSLLNIEARGVKADDVVVMQYPDLGVKLYGNAIIASPKLIKENPAALKAFLAAFAKGAKDVIADPAKAIESVKARDGIINSELETRRLKLAIDTVINSSDARAEGFGQVKGPRLSLMASQVSDAFNTKTRVKADDVWNGSFLPTAKELDVLPKGKK
jgi:NitT/TauT family transport system substrate-binding protein